MSGLDKDDKKGIFRRAYSAISPKWSRSNLDNIAGMGGVASKGFIIRNAFGSLKETLITRQRRKESFEEALVRLEITEESLKTNYSGLRRNSRIAYAASFLITMLTLYYAIQTDAFIYAIFAIAAFIYCFLLGMVSSYRAHQIINRKFISFSEWLKLREEWFI